MNSSSTIPANLLPAEWDPSSDLLVVLGPGPTDLMDALEAVGQKRVIEYVPAELGAPTSAGKVLRAHNLEELLEVIMTFTGSTPTRAVLHRPAGTQVAPQTSQELSKALGTCLELHRISSSALEDHGLRMVTQGIRNMPQVASLPSIQSLHGAFEGRPCAIVSPGPSLDKNIAQLSELAGRALIMTCSHALGALNAAGIAVDMVFDCDPKDIRRHYHAGDLSDVGAKVLAATVDPKLFEFETPLTFTFASASHSDWLFDPIDEGGGLSFGGSVACAEFALARVMGCSPILLVGQDLALTEGEYYTSGCIDEHASVETDSDGKTFHLLHRRAGEHLDVLDGLGDPIVVAGEQEGLIEVPAWGGGSVSTSISFYSYLQWFSFQAQSLGPQCEAVNCTEGGAFIKGMRHATLASVLDEREFPSFDVRGTLRDCAAGTDVDSRRRSMAEHVQHSTACLQECASLARKCTALAQKVLSGDAALEKLDQAERKLMKRIRPVRFFSLIAQAKIVNAIEKANQAQDLEQNLNSSMALYAVIEEAGQLLLEPLQEAASQLALARSK